MITANPTRAIMTFGLNQPSRKGKMYTQSKIKNTTQEILKLISSKELQLHEAITVIKKVKKSLKNGKAKGNVAK